MNQVTANLIKASGRSWWQVRYNGGKVLSEWETLVGIGLSLIRFKDPHKKTSRWEEIPKKGIVGIRLLCPNGMASEFEVPPESPGVFQLKAGSVSPLGQACESHIIGVVVNDNGDCECAAWDIATHNIVTYRDNIFKMTRYSIGCLNLEVQGIRM